MNLHGHPPTAPPRVSYLDSAGRGKVGHVTVGFSRLGMVGFLLVESATAAGVHGVRSDTDSSETRGNQSEVYY